MRTQLTTWAAAAVTAFALAAAGAAAGAPASGAKEVPGPGQRTTVTTGPVEVVDTYTAPYADAWFQPSAAIADRSGVVTATWSDRGVQVAQRAIDGTWGAPTRLFSCTMDQSCDYGGARLTADPAGVVTAVWEATTPVPAVYASTHAPGGAWSAPVPVSGSDRRAGGAMDIVTAENGAVLLAYTAYVHGKGWVVVTRYRAVGASWAQARRHVFGHAAAPQVGMAANGVSVLGVTRSWSSSALRTYRFRPGHGWSRPVVHGVTFDGGWDLATDAAGRTLIAWDSAPSGHRPALVARVMNRHGHWAARHVLTHRAVSTIPYVAMHHDPVVLWSTNRGTIRSATRASGRPWTITTAYGRHSGALRDLATGPRGDLVVTWENWANPTTPRLLAGVRPAGGAWTAPVVFPSRYVGENVSASGFGAVLPDGSAVVVTNDTDADVATWPEGSATLRILAQRLVP